MGGRVFELSSDWQVKSALCYEKSQGANDGAGLGSTTKEVTGKDGRKEWVSPLVKAKGKLLYSKGRMGRAYGANEWEAYEEMVKLEEA